MNPTILSIDKIGSLPAQRLADLSPHELATLSRDLAEQKAKLAALDERLTSALDLRYGARAAQSRAQAGKDTGSARFEDNGYVVVADLPKRVKWDQEKLRQAVEVIRTGWNDDPADYVRTKLEVSEAAFANWPRAVRELFLPARTVETGRPSYRLEARKAGGEA